MALKKTIDNYTDAYWRLMINENYNRENRSGDSFVTFTWLAYADKAASDADSDDTQWLYKGHQRFDGEDYPCTHAFVNAEGNNAEKAVYIKVTDVAGTFGEFKAHDRLSNVQWFDLSDGVDA